VSFVAPADQALFKALKGEAFEVQVGIHELLGHGSGKLFHQGTPDAAALQESGMAHPVLGAGAALGPLYGPGATWDSTFGKLASPYEECRAECCGLFLCLESSVLEVFGHATKPPPPSAERGAERGGDDAGLLLLGGNAGECHDVSYVNWLLMARAGLTGLEFYTPETRGWRQAHMMARFVILRVLLEAAGTEAGRGIVELRRTTSPLDGAPDVEVKLDRALVRSAGRDAVGAFLLKLQTFKSLGDAARGSALFSSYAAVDAEMLELRAVVMARKEPRKLLVQPHLRPGPGGDETLAQYEDFDDSPAGLVASFVARFPATDPELDALAATDAPHVTDN
jgi:dipeptidyl-peptidase III